MITNGDQILKAIFDLSQHMQLQKNEDRLWLNSI